MAKPAQPPKPTKPTSAPSPAEKTATSDGAAADGSPSEASGAPQSLTTEISSANVVVSEPSWTDKGQFWIGFITLLVFAVSILFAWNTLTEMAAQTSKLSAALEISTRQLEVTDRPWIKVHEIKPDGGGALQDMVGVTGWITLRNIGNSVADAVSVETQLVLTNMFEFPTDEVLLRVRSVQDSLCVEKMGLLSGSLFPQDFARFRFRKAADLAVFAKQKENLSVFSNSFEKPIGIPILVGCAMYRFQSSAQPHYTRFAFALRPLETAEPRLDRYLILSESWKSADVLFEAIANLMSAQ